MPDRARDWLRQAERDLGLARAARASGHHEWACFAAQQAAEKAVKGLFQHLHLEAWGHVVHQLLELLPDDGRAPADLVERARRLDRHYIPTRYPNGFDAGAPGDFYTDRDAAEAIDDGEAVLAFCAGRLT
jgi:HEPN domain-containing protein